MSDSLQLAFTLLMVGMVTVFTILALVIIGGKGLIKLTNRYAPVEINTSGKANLFTHSPPSSISSNKLAAIIAAVNHMTEGKGHVDSINKK